MPILNIDIVIIILFLAVNLIAGLYSGKGIKDIKDYAIGDRNFSTATIAATLVATWIAGSSLTIKVSETYSQGLYFIAANLADPFCFIIIGCFFAPRMAEFLGKVSVAEAMGDLYGNSVRLITIISSIGISVGYIGLQIKVMSVLLDYFFGMGSLVALIFVVLITVIYSAVGGIKAVTFTDTLQLFTFGVFIPSLALIIWGTLNDPSLISHTLLTNQLFDYKEFFSLDNPKFFSWLVLFLYCLLPSLDPAVFQRISMSSDTNQVRRSFLIASGFIMLLCLVMYTIGILLLSSNANLNASNIVGYIVDNYSYTGLKGLTIVGILAMAMSTADSYINSCAILLSHDLPKVLGIRIMDKTQLLWSRICALAIGILALIPALLATNLLKMLLIMANFYMPVVSIPLILAIFGFRSTSKSVLIGMGFGVTTVIIFNYLNVAIDSVIPGMIANLIGFIGSHYLLGQSGGWVGIKDQTPLIESRKQRQRLLYKLKLYIKNFSLLAACKNNAPKQESIYTLFGVFCIISVFSTMYSIPKDIQQQYTQILGVIYHTILICSTILITYPIWPSTFKQENFIIVFWNIAVPYVLVFAPTLLVIISNLGQFQLMILMINMIIISILFRWQVATIIITISLLLSIQFYKYYFDMGKIALNIGLQFKIMYLLLLVSSVLIAFLKPKQEYQELVEEKNDHLAERLDFQEQALKESLELKTEFLRNISHEYNTPLTGIMSMSEVLQAAYYKLNDEQRMRAIDDIVHSAARLECFDTNIKILSRISKGKLELTKQELDLSSLVDERVQRCRKLYDENSQNHQFILSIKENVSCKADQEHLTKAIDNLIINAIQYCPNGKILIELKIEGDGVIFSIADEGVGIPKTELHNIFDSFKVSSKTHTTAGGRGVGLTVAQKIIEFHGGKIWAESDGTKGAVFSFRIPAVG